jgi:hypothetical protein|nr:MAG TPA: hypothetical protein [Caudoviricetes sp.]
MPLKQVYNTIVDDLGDVDNIYDLVRGIDAKASEYDPMYM